MGSKLKQSCWHPQNTVGLKMWANKLLHPSPLPDFEISRAFPLSSNFWMKGKSSQLQGEGAYMWTTDTCTECQQLNTETEQEAPHCPWWGDRIISSPEVHHGAGPHTLRNWSEIMGGGNGQSQSLKNSDTFHTYEVAQNN